MAADDDWPVVVSNLSQARAVWKRMTRILSREGAEPRLSGFFFKSVVPVVLLFDSETWVVTHCMVRALGGFQYQLTRRLTGRILRQKPDLKWGYTLVAAAREKTGF